MRNFATQLFWRTVLLLTILTAASPAGATSASFAWNASPDAASGKVTGYKFYYSSQSFASLPPDVAINPAFTIVNVTGGTTAQLNNLVGGQTYYMTVTATGPTTIESAPSNILAYTAPADPTPPPPTPPPTPAPAMASFTWNASPDAASGKIITYKLYYSTQSFTSIPAGVATNPAFTIVAVTDKITLTLTNLIAGQNYYMAVTATAPNQVESVPSNVLSFIPAANSLPMISLVNISEGALLSQPVSLSALASDSDGAINSVEFFANNTSLGVVTGEPYSVALPLYSGTYAFRAKATDNRGGFAYTAPVTAVVKPAPPVDLVIK